MKRYTEYKDSGVEWLGEIPHHWAVKKLKFIGDAFIGVTYSPDDVVENEKLGTLVLRSSNIQDGKLCLDDCVYIRKDISDKGTTREGDILICSRNGSRALIGKNICIDKNIAGASFGAFMTIFRTEYHRFIYHYMNSQIFIGQSSLFLTSTINQLTITTLNCFQTALPPRDEQKIIASFLDQKTSQIDSLISNKKRMIDLLKEERAAIINHAVTKGINPDAEMKDSGVEWLGEIPKNWRISRLKYLCEGKLMYGANEIAENEDKSQPRYIRITDFGDDGKLRDDTFKSLPQEKAEPYLLKDGDILFARSGATVGKTFQFKDYRGQACFAGYLIKAAPKKSILISDFFYLFTKSSVYDNWKNSIFNQATIQNIGADKYNNFILCLPPVQEQKSIVTYLDQKTSQIDSSINQIQKEISLIEEYRTALINETVTGKIDIRDEVNS